MKLTQFEYDLPASLIAKYPAKERDLSRLMVLDRKTEKIEHLKFRDIQEFFNEGDVAVVNNTKVFPARVYGRKEKTGARIEVFLLRELNSKYNLWDVMVDPARKIRVGNKLYFGDNDLVAEVVDNTTSRGRTLRFLYEGDYNEFKRTLDKLGETPIPHYLKRKVEPLDTERYQTVFAEHSGAVAAPTAGLHFTRALVKRMELRGVTFCPVTLHVGLGTFRPIEVEDLSKHKMDSEEFEVTAKTAEMVNRAKQQRKNVCVIGTTTMRAVETAVGANGFMKPARGWTNKFIFPPYNFNIATHMVTNFHLPLSSLLMMVCAFGGYDFVTAAYKEAVKKKYRFFTYGDAMLIK